MAVMPTYIALLRAVNVGGRVYKMADLREHLAASGLDAVETYIQTGNVRFMTSMRSPAKVERHVESVLREGAGFEVPAIVLTPAELRQVYDDAMGLAAPFAAGAPAGGHRRYVTFFKPGEEPDEEAAAAIKSWDRPGEFAVPIGRAVHVWLDRPSMQAEFFGAFKKVLAPGTNRDLKVVSTLAQRWAQAPAPGSAPSDAVGARTIRQG
jgi:uncharacterized protein (DUF1697 family)